jgi:hypothetical protein
MESSSKSPKAESDSLTVKLYNFFKSKNEMSETVLEYLKRDKKISKEDTVRYMEGVLDLYKRNMEAIPWTI